MRNDNTNALRSLREIAKDLLLWRHAPIYLGVMGLAKIRAHRELRAKEWERDESSRAAFGNDG